MDPEFWTVDEVGEYLEEHNFNQYRRLFCEENGIDGKRLLTLTEKDLNKQPLEIVIFGDRKRLWFLIDNLQEDKRLSDQRRNHSIDKYTYSKVNKYMDEDHMSSQSGLLTPLSVTSSSYSDDEYISTKGQKTNRKKFALSVLYLFTAHFSSGYAVTYAQEHLPDKKKYPPLPDVFLDNLPYIPWAYRITEGAIMILTFSGLTLLFFHRYRFAVIQRLMIIAGTLYLLRSACVMSTSIPMPQKKYDCDRLELKDGWERLMVAVRFYLAIGMKTNGIKTCGDYVFSGHTVIITLLVLSVNEYTPRRFTYLHTLNWIIGFCGAFFILLGHGHYTLDLVLAFAISSKLFTAHHIFAINMSLMTKDTSRIKVCFPIFYFFERDTDGSIPNEYECPLPGFKKIQTIYYDLKCGFCNLCSLKSKALV